MGSFRIVSGSGYARQEITDVKKVKDKLAQLQRVAENPAILKTRVWRKGRVVTPLTLYDKVWGELTRKANKWARETAAGFRAEVPVDTGNLRGSIHVLEDACWQDKNSGKIRMVVGVDLDPRGGYNRLYPPPHMKRSPKHGRKKAPWKGYREMPEYPNEYATKIIGGTVIEKQFELIAKTNAKKIMGK